MAHSSLHRWRKPHEKIEWMKFGRRNKSTESQLIAGLLIHVQEDFIRSYGCSCCNGSDDGEQVPDLLICQESKEHKPLS
jgi:hypothetical protein